MGKSKTRTRGKTMPRASVADHWATGDVYATIVSALEASSKSLGSLTVEDLAPVDHFHARGFPATVELADRLPVRASDHILDIGCGLGGPGRYFAQRFGCAVDGIDLTEPFVEAAKKLTELVGLSDRVSFQQGDAHRLPFADGIFDGAYSQHVTMNVADRRQFFAEARRVLKPGAFFALTEHGLGPAGSPHHPVPWSEDGSGEWLAAPDETLDLLTAAGFADIEIEDTGTKYLEAYRGVLALAERGELPPLGMHLLLGKNAIQKVRNAARNIEEERTRPVQVFCRKPLT
jgi:SAM-dependent methyltransferase